MHLSARRRKKRLNYGMRTVEVERGPNGFGFTISGQQPCILSCIVTNSPADISGLRAGDFLISVNGVNVSKLAHDAVVGLIGNCFSPIQMTIAENYYSDSSDEDVEFGRIANVRKQKLKPNKVKQPCRSFDRCHLDTAHSSTSNNENFYGLPNISYEMLKENCGPLEYKVIVGYLGTIEMPKQLLPNARFDTVITCIRKLRQEKRCPTSVLMTVLPTCLTLKNTSNHILAIYPVNRVVYINSLAEKECRYFGLVTSAVSDSETSEDTNEFTISNSCHVFSIDTKLVEHEIHVKKAESFKITCTIDVVTGNCLEFPKSATYIVKLIQNLYRFEDTEGEIKNEDFVANSPQPSASSNSDSGIGYRDECGNISDRILVVEFPSKSLPILPMVNKRPANVTASNITPDNLDDNSLFKNYNIESIYGEKQVPNITNIRACEKISNRLTVRVMPTKSEFSERPIDVPETISLYSLDIDFRSSIDNISVHSTKSADLKPIFKTPKFFEYKKSRKLKPVNSCDNLISERYEEKVLSYKLSPKVYGISKPAQSCEELNSREVEGRMNFGSLQDLNLWCLRSGDAPNVTQSSPDVRVEKQKKMEREGSELNSEGPSAWLTSFEKLVACPVGLHAFAEFLKKEFSAENIYFWTACERFRLMPDGPEKKSEAERIFNRHLRIGCPDAINVDSKARQFAEHSLKEADSSTFQLAQKQIFNLMKFDSYPRFIKSDIYNHILNGNGSCPELDTSLLVNPIGAATSTKLKKSLSNAEDRRRKSLLPWHKKNRSKSKDRGENDITLEQENNNGKLTDTHGSKNSLDLQNQDGTLTRQNLCRVNLHSDYSGGTTIAQVRDAETIQQMVDRLLEKRGLTFFTYDITTDKSSKPLDLASPAHQLIGCQVFVERKVTFKLDLPNRKIISVKSKHSKVISDVLRHILQRYNYSLPEVDILVDGALVNVDLPVTSIENKRLLVSMRETRPRVRSQNASTKSLDEITNRVYKDILQGKSEASLSVKSKSDRSSVKSEDLGSEHSSIFGRFLRRDSGILDKKKKLLSRSKGPSTNSSVEDVTGGDSGSSANVAKKPLIAKWVSGTKLHVAHSEREELYEGLSRMQRSRLEDQRGTEINFELPDFLKDKENTKKASNKKQRYAEDRERSKFYTKPSTQEYENHVISSKESNSEDTSCSSNQSTPSKSLEVTVIEQTESRVVRNTEPPPLPPKPKIVPIKPSNWGQNDFSKKELVQRTSERNDELFLEQATSSFV